MSCVFQVYDLFHLREMKGGPIEVQPDVLYSEFGNAHNIVANEETKMLYVVGATRGNYVTCDGKRKPWQITV